VGIAPPSADTDIGGTVCFGLGKGGGAPAAGVILPASGAPPMLPIAAMPPMSVAFAGPEPTFVAGVPVDGVRRRGMIGGGLLFPVPINVVAAGGTEAIEDGLEAGGTDGLFAGFGSTGASLAAGALASARLRKLSSIAARASSGSVDGRVAFAFSSAAGLGSVPSALRPGSGGGGAFASPL